MSQHDPDEVGELIEPHPGGAWVTDENATVGLHTDELAHNIAVQAARESWVEDIEASDRYARTHAYKEGLPPHWHRCNFVRAGVRCCKTSGHHMQPGKAAEHAEPPA